MRNSSLIHDAAWLTAREVTKMLILEDENRAVMFAQIYETIRAGIESYETKAERRASRLEPGIN